MFQNKIILFVFVLLPVFITTLCATPFVPKTQFKNDPIDVVIPSTDKDLKTLNLCIRGIRQNCKEIRRIIVVSKKLLTNEAEWFDESRFPFDKSIVSKILVEKNSELANKYNSDIYPRAGWYYQQLLKFYAPFVIPDISSNVLILDSDTIFLRRIKFLGPSNQGLYCTGSECHWPYFEHANRLLPNIKKVFPNYSGIVHHMLFQRPILNTLFEAVEAQHKIPFWQAFCLSVDPISLTISGDTGSGASEYEIYFNFIFSQNFNVKIRPLNWIDTDTVDNLVNLKEQGFDFVTCHSWLRND